MAPDTLNLDGWS